MTDRFIYNRGLIDIDVPMGVNVYEGYSAIGKSYLVQLLRQIDSIIDDDIKKVYTASQRSEYKAMFNKMSSIPDNSLVVLDRFDLNKSIDYVNMLFEIRDRLCVLVDSKQVISIPNMHYITSKIDSMGKITISDKINNSR